MGGKPKLEAYQGGGCHKLLEHAIPVWGCSLEEWHPSVFCSAGGNVKAAANAFLHSVCCLMVLAGGLQRVKMWWQVFYSCRKCWTTNTFLTHDLAILQGSKLQLQNVYIKNMGWTSCHRVPYCDDCKAVDPLGLQYCDDSKQSIFVSENVIVSIHTICRLSWFKFARNWTACCHKVSKMCRASLHAVKQQLKANNKKHTWDWFLVLRNITHHFQEITSEVL